MPSIVYEDNLVSFPEPHANSNHAIDKGLKR
jgi:hypothetical protein